MATPKRTNNTRVKPQPQPKTRPTIAEMKAQLAQINPKTEVYTGEPEHAVAEAIGTGVATAINKIGSAGEATATFFDAMTTSFKYTRAVAKGEICSD